jgi:FixJ family two-component response regulator
MTSAKAIVVVVDDDMRVLRSLGNLLSSAGYDARLFSAVEDVLTSPDIKSAGCFIADIGIPDVSGLDVLRRINATGMELPCILLTRNSVMDRDTVTFCRTRGAKFLFRKPVNGPELLAAVALLTSSPGLAGPR